MLPCSNSSILTFFQDQGGISGPSTRFFTTNTALRAVKEAKEHDKSYVDFTRQCGKSPVTTSAVLLCVYLAWKHPRRRIEVIFQVSRPAFLPQKRPCVRSKRLRSTMYHTLTSSGNVISPQSQRAQFFIAFILPGSTHAAGSRWHFRSIDLLFHHKHGLACGQRG
jgi:hypothetical protein